MFKAYLGGIPLHLLKKKKKLKKIGGGHRGFPHCSAMCPCHSGITVVNATDQSRGEWKERPRVASELLVRTLPIPIHPLISLGQQVAQRVTLGRSSARKGNPYPEKRGNKRKQQLWHVNHVLLWAIIKYSNVYKDLAPALSDSRRSAVISQTHSWKTVVVAHCKWKETFLVVCCFGFFAFLRKAEYLPLHSFASVAFSSLDF